LTVIRSVLSNIKCLDDERNEMPVVYRPVVFIVTGECVVTAIINWGFGFLLTDYAGFSSSLFTSLMSML